MKNTQSLLALAALLAVCAGCTPRPPATAYHRDESHAFTDTGSTELGRMYGKQAVSHPGASGFHIINSGLSALMTRVMLVDKAQRSIDMQYYTSRDDKTGQLLFEAVERAAARGVRVRILLDDWYLDDFKKGAVAIDAHPNIDIRIFNPYSTREQSVFDRIGHAPSYLSDYDRRMHNKGFIVDNQVAVMGGRNLGDEYFDTGAELNLRDIDLFTTGPVVGELSTSFDRYWNSDEAYPLSALNLPAPTKASVIAVDKELHDHWNAMLSSPDGLELRSMPLPYKVRDGSVTLDWAPAMLVADKPEKVNTPPEQAASAPANQIERLASRAQHEFTFITPYFVPMDTGVQWLSSLVARGVHVRIVTNSLSSTDMVPAQSGYDRYREDLVKDGVELYEVKSVPPKSPSRKMLTPSASNGLHAKVYMIDRRYLVIGSFNFDQRSLKLNTEQALVIDSEALCQRITKLFDELSSPDQSYRVILASNVPEAQKPTLNMGALAWVTREDGQVKYFDFNPHAGFLRRVTSGFFSLLPFDKEL